MSDTSSEVEIELSPDNWNEVCVRGLDSHTLGRPPLFIRELIFGSQAVLSMFTLEQLHKLATQQEFLRVADR